ncbi:unnamed protein product [Ectocarpus sp. 12 AP-2014]
MKQRLSDRESCHHEAEGVHMLREIRDQPTNLTPKTKGSKILAGDQQS